jgi:WXG100 family type VII secretion target
MTLAEFKVNLADLDDATNSVAAEAKNIRTLTEQITQRMKDAERVWICPAAGGYTDLQVVASTDMERLNTVLDGMVQRMRVAYQNYRHAEETNFRNVS